MGERSPVGTPTGRAANMARRLPQGGRVSGSKPLTRIVILLSPTRMVTALFATTFVLACSTEAAPPSRTPSTTRAAGTKSGTTKTDDPAEGSVDLGRVKYTPGVL